MVANMTNTRQPMLLFWGAEWTQFYNDAFVPSFGAGKHPDAMGQSARDCWADAWPVIGAQLEAVVSRGEPTWHEDALVPIFRNGRMEEVFWTYSYSPAYDDAGAIAGVLVIVTEMTGRVLAERRLRGLTALSTTLASATTDEAVYGALRDLAQACPADLPTVSAIDRHGREHLDGALQTAALREGLSELGAPLTAGPWPEPVTDAFVARSVVGVLAAGLSPRLPHDTAYLAFVGQVFEQVRGALGRIAAAHERMRSDEERAAMLSALEEANRAKDEFLAMLGHELRNPLAPILTAVELMKAKGLEPANERAAIERQIHHLVRLVDDLLDVARIARGELELHRAPCDIADVVAMAVDATRILIEQRQHTLSVDVGTGLLLDADHARLVQVVSNLLTNAARYTPPGGRIEVSARHDANDIRIEVSDDGKGIEPELTSRIFDLFVQGKRSADRAEGGLGIGLAVVKNLVAVHGGTVAVTSGGNGKGSRFVVRLPASSATQPHQPAASPARLGGTPAGKRILLVDDNVDAVHLLGEVARNSGHEVMIAEHPEVALQILDGFVPDVAVLDIGLPMIDGYELGRRIRERHPSCRVVALSGYGQPRDRQRSAEAGFFAHLVKPVRIKVFLDLIA
jgi:signal transduction histidine kinase